MIHPTAIIDSSAILGRDVTVGAYSIIGANVVIGDGCVIGPHVVIKGDTRIGAHNQFYQFSSIGEDCQDKKYQGEKTFLEIGDHNIFREFVTVHRGTVNDHSLTSIGNGGLFMNYSHIAHDCQIGDDVIVANGSQLAGHVHVGKGAIIGGTCGVHQFCRIGDYAMLGGGTTLFKDVPAFVTVQGNPAAAHGMNYEGMKRRGYDKSVIHLLRNAYKLVYRQGATLHDAVEELQTWKDDSGELQRFIDSIHNATRGIVR